MRAWWGVTWLLWSASAMGQEPACTVPLLVRGASGFSIEIATVPAGEMRAFRPGGTPQVVAPILPMAPGLGGDLVRAADANRMLAVRCTGGEVRIAVGPPGGAMRELPAVPVGNYQRYTMRLHVTDHLRQGTLFHIRSGEVARGEGPVLDMFQGRLPMAPGDVALTLEVVAAAATRPPLSGTIPIEALGPWAATAIRLPGGRTARFVVDLAATRTVVTRSLLAAGTPLHDLVAVEHSRDGVRQLAAGAQGAGGEAGSVGRVADLPWMDVGALRVDSVRPLVMERPLVAGTDTVWGILGLDVLRRAGRIRGSLTAPVGPATLVLGGPPLTGGIEIPVRDVRGLLVAEGAAGPERMLWLLDSGSRLSAVPEAVAERLGWIAAGAGGDSLRGIDGAPFLARRATVPPPRLGSWTGPAIPFVAATFPVIAAMGLTDQTGILGQPFFRAVGDLEIDFERGVLRLPARPAR